MSYLESLKKNIKTNKKKSGKKKKDLIDEKNNALDFYSETDYEKFDRKYGMLLFDFYYDIVEELSDKCYYILDKEYLGNNTYVKETQTSDFVSEESIDSDDDF